MDNLTKFKSKLSAKMDKITNSIAEKVELSEKLLESTESLESEFEKDLEFNIIEDFKFIRDELKTTTQMTRQILKDLSDGLMLVEDNSGYNAFAEISKVQTDALKLFINSYKELSIILLNVNKAKGTTEVTKSQDNYNIINITEQANVADIIKRLKS